jgi:HEAT repeat protein
VSPEWKDDRRKLIDALYDDVVAILKTDVDPRVRHEALLAVGNLQLIVEGPDLPPDVINLLIDRFREDPDPSIRSEVVKSLRLITSDSPDLRAVLRDALLDPQDSVRLGAQSAIQPHATPHIKLTFAEARGAIETALTSADADRRRAAVQALNNFGRAAREYLPRLQVLAANDPDSRVRESATLAIAAIHRDGG